jgi:hypothetical protein
MKTTELESTPALGSGRVMGHERKNRTTGGN